MQFRTSQRHPQLRRAILPIVAILAITALFGSVAAAKTSKRVVGKAQSPALGTVLTANSGLTLYTLSAEKNGHFICKGSCLKTWFPLVVAPGVKPTGPVALGTIKRPDGRRQVTFDGRPLYVFDGDSKRGDTKGEGIKDVGTWHAARP
jgi:predicted lipoprotein with Yx(FWY)xxD motif